MSKDTPEPRAIKRAIAQGKYSKEQLWDMRHAIDMELNKQGVKPQAIDPSVYTVALAKVEEEKRQLANSLTLDFEKQLEQTKRMAFRDGFGQGLNEYDLFHEELREPYLRAVADLQSHIAAISAFINVPDSTWIKQAVTGYSERLSGSIQNFLNRLEALGESEEDAKLYEYVELLTLVSQSLGRIETSGSKDKNKLNLSIAETKTALAPLTGNFFARLASIPKPNQGGNIVGMKQWRHELAKEWLEIEQVHPGITAKEVRILLLERRQTWATDGNGQRHPVPKNPYSDEEKEQIKALNKKNAKINPSDFRLKLLGDYEKSLLRG